MVQQEAADGFTPFLGKRRAHFLIEFCNRHTAVHGVAALTQIFDADLIDLVRRTVNFTENALQKVFHGDQTGDTAIFINGKGNGQLALPKGAEKIGGQFGLGYKIWLSQKSLQSVRIP